MKIDEMTVLQYIDNDLSKDDRRVFEALLENDEALQEQVQIMKSSELPYQAAFSSEMLAEMPASIEAHLEQADALINDDQEDANFFKRYNSAVVAGLFIVVFVAGVFSQSFIKQTVFSNDHELARFDVQSELVDSMIIYQALYSRPTVVPVHQTLPKAQVVLDKFLEKSKVKLDIPNLESLGFEFRRAQVLSYEDRPILQLVYLPEQGEPLAICLTYTEDQQSTDEDAVTYNISGMKSNVWSKQGIVYMLMNRTNEMPLKDIYHLVTKA